MLRISVAVILTLCVLGLSACGSLKHKSDDTANLSERQLYHKAHDALEKHDYAKAVKFYEQLQLSYPYSRYTQQAMLEDAYANYKNGDADTANTWLDRFIKLYPNHPHVDYAYYLKALCSFKDDVGLMVAFAGQDPTERDSKGMQDAFSAFNEVVKRFPDSAYAEDAARRMIYIYDALAANDVGVARYYYRRGAYLAAADRSRDALQMYPRAPANEEGLVILVAAYDKLGLTDLRNDAKRVLDLNYPHTKYVAGLVNHHKRWWQLWNEGAY